MDYYKITQGNKLIHEFMGKEVQERYGQGESIYVIKKRRMKKGYEIPDNVTTMPKEELDSITEDVWYNINDVFDGLKYNRSWDWLMPVVDKIESLSFNVVIENHVSLKKKPQCYIYNPAETFEGKPIERDKKIDAVYEAVLEFIDWHNNEKAVAVTPNEI